ncbi:MAG: sigma 54-interacting transcriptional regulator [Thermoanaerobacterium sp.]|nr:sigma 54-interacting transcriptional regulator [Thermoanaerobacterium sp.]
MKKVIEKCEMLDKQLKLYKKEFANLNKAKYNLDDIHGISPQINACKKKVLKIAKVNLNVLIEGESGVGKELFAQSIHNESDRSNYPFVSVNCSAIPETLFEAELFGYEDGSFTGAKKGGKMGKFELANGGTVFLDEIGDMPLQLQAKLLRVIQEKEIVRIGGNIPISIDVRIISATHKNLKQMVSDGTFREDLYYRLNILSLVIPPLRERRDDIPILAESFVEDFYKETGIFKKLSNEVLESLKVYEWPGNVRELKNVIDKLCVNSEKVQIDIGDLQEFLGHNFGKNKITDRHHDLNALVKEYEKKIILKVLKECNNNKSKAARELNIPRITLYRKIKEYNLEMTPASENNA